jgi:hypothetical protein
MASHCIATFCATQNSPQCDGIEILSRYVSTDAIATFNMQFMCLKDSCAVATVILFHGNGSNYGDGIYASSKLMRLRCNVLMLSYRG